MAGNLPSMFGQLNQAISNSPILDRDNQGVRGMPSSPMDNMNPLMRQFSQGLGKAMGDTKGDYTTSQDKMRLSNSQAASAVTSQDPRMLTEAAGLMIKQGRIREGQELMQRADRITNSDVAVLEEGQADIDDQAARTQAIEIAKDEQDDLWVRYLQTGDRTAAEYYKWKDKQSENMQKESLYRSRPRSGKSGSSMDEPMPAYLGKILQGYTEEAQAAGSRLSRAQSLSSRFTQWMDTEGVGLPTAGGLVGGAAKSFRNAAGIREVLDALQTDYQGLRNSAAMKNLPPGSASDKDVALAMSGFLPDNASVQNIRDWLKSYARAQELSLEYNRFAEDHVSEKRENTFINKSWEAYLKERDEREEEQNTLPSYNDMVNSSTMPVGDDE
jgi:hypothetical protein